MNRLISVEMSDLDQSTNGLHDRSSIGSFPSGPRDVEVRLVMHFDAYTFERFKRAMSAFFQGFSSNVDTRRPALAPPPQA